jgi:cyclopropane fatty-acyl-phospholipid synthase-like methyltransferase
MKDSEQLARCYDLIDFRHWETTGLYPTEKVVLARLGQLPAGSRVLDFGCSSGRLLSNLVGRHQCIGLEINEQAAAVARAKGIQIVAALDEIQPRSLDAAVMVDVFEHLPRPTETFRS